VLADDGLVQFVFHGQEALRLVGADAGQWHAGHLVDDFANDFAIDDAVHFLGLVAPFLGDGVLAFLELVRLVAQVSGFLEILLGDGGFLLLVQLLDLAVDFLEIRWPRHGPQANACAGFVDDVDRLIGQATAWNVAIRQFDRFFERFVLDLDFVMRFVAIAQTLQNLDRFFGGRRVDDDLLEAAFERAVFFNVLAVFVKRRRADALDLAASESGLQHVGGVDRPFPRRRRQRGCAIRR